MSEYAQQKFLDHLPEIIFLGKPSQYFGPASSLPYQLREWMISILILKPQHGWWKLQEEKNPKTLQLTAKTSEKNGPFATQNGHQKSNPTINFQRKTSLVSGGQTHQKLRTKREEK